MASLCDYVDFTHEIIIQWILDIMRSLSPMALIAGDP